MNDTERLREILKDIFSKPYPRYNEGLLPGEEGYDEVQIYQNQVYKEKLDEAVSQLQALLDEARLDEVRKLRDASFNIKGAYPEWQYLRDQVSELTPRKEQ